MNYRSTVIIPVFNSGSFLDEAVESVLLQSNGKDQIIIIDDASTDVLTINAIEKLRSNPVVEIVRHERNKGLGAARNTGVVNALADIIIPLDSDDMLADGYFEKMLPPFSDPNIAFTYCDVQCFGDSNDLWKSSDFSAEKIVDSQYICGCSPFRKSVHQSVGGYCEEEVFLNMNEDWDFWLSVCENGYKGVYVPCGQYFYRRHESSMSCKPRTFSPAVQKHLLKRHSDFITKYKTPDQFMAQSYKDAASAYIKLGKPIEAVRYLCKLIFISGWRKDGLKLILSALGKLFVSINNK